MGLRGTGAWPREQSPHQPSWLWYTAPGEVHLSCDNELGALFTEQEPHRGPCADLPDGGTKRDRGDREGSRAPRSGWRAWGRGSLTVPSPQVPIPPPTLSITPILSPQGSRGELLLSLCYNPSANSIIVNIIKARNLKAMDIGGTSGAGAPRGRGWAGGRRPGVQGCAGCGEWVCTVALTSDPCAPPQSQLPLPRAWGGPCGAPSGSASPWTVSSPESGGKGMRRGRPGFRPCRGTSSSQPRARPGAPGFLRRGHRGHRVTAKALAHSFIL